MKRSFCVFSTAFAIFSVLSVVLGETFCIISLLMILLASPIAVVRSYKRGKAVFRDTLILIIFILSALLIAYFITLPRISDAEALDGSYLKGEGSVVSVSSSGIYTVAVVRCDVLNGRKSSQKVSVIQRNNEENIIDLGWKISFEGVAEFEASAYNKGKECFLTVFPAVCEISESDKLIDKITYAIRSRLRSSADSMDGSELVKALTIGDKSGISEQTENDFKKLGISHILAISGLHLSIIVMSTYGSVTRLGMPHVLAIIFSMLLCLLYLLMTGFSPSLLRASQMMAVFFLSMIIRRKKDGLTSLFFAGWCILLISQWSVFNVGFLLSFFSTMGILVFVRPISDAYSKSYLDKLERGVKYSKLQKTLHSLTGSLLVSVVTTVAATLFSLPVILFTINEVSLFSLIGNLAVVPLAEYYLTFSVWAVSFKSLGFDLLSGIIGAASSFFGRLITLVVEALGRIAPDTVSLSPYYLTVGATVSVIMVLFFFIKSKKLWSLPLMTLFFAVYIPLFNLVSDGLIYDTAVIDCTSRTGIYTSLVQLRGKDYLLDLTSTGSRKIGNIDDILEDYGVSYVDKAVFAVPNEACVERIEMFLSLVDIGEIVILTDADIDFQALRSMCSKRNVPTKFIYKAKYEVCEGINAYMQSDIGSAFVIENGERSLSAYMSYSSEEFIQKPTKADILIFDGKECGIKHKLSPDGHYRLHA